MKKFISLFSLLLILGFGCTSSDQSLIIQNQQKQIEELTKKVGEMKPEKSVTQLPTPPTLQREVNQNDDLYQKKQDCLKYQKTIEEKFNNRASINLFFSPSKNTCIYEATAIKDGVVISRSLIDVFGDGFVIEQNGELIYDKKMFGEDRIYNEIYNILKN